MSELAMPSLGSGMEAGVLVAWRVTPGDVLTRGDIVAEIETEKGIIEIETFEPGVVGELIGVVGERYPVGAPLLRFAEPSEAPGGAEAQAPASAEVSRSEAVASREEVETGRREREAEAEAAGKEFDSGGTKREAEARGEGSGETVRGVASTTPAWRGVRGVASFDRMTPAARRLVRRGLAPPEAVARGPLTPYDLGRLEQRARVRASPLARRRAEALGVVLDAVAPGPDGVVHAAEVEASAARGSLPPREVEAHAPGATAASPEDPQRAMRRAIASAMSLANREIPHYYLTHTIDLGPALGWLRETNATRPLAERVLPGVLLLKAVALALREVPELNAHYVDGEAPPIEGVHLGVAIALRRGGLMAPAIHDADQRSLAELMTALEDLVRRVRAGRVRGAELAGSTATVTSLGDRGVEAVYPIINPPQVAMIGFGRILDRPHVVGSELAVRPTVVATLAADHRVSDGHRGGLFLTALERWLERPEEL